MRLFAALVLALAAQTHAASVPKALPEYLDWELAHGSRPRHEQLNLNVPWTCLEHGAQGSPARDTERLVVVTLTTRNDGTIAANFPYLPPSDTGRATPSLEFSPGPGESRYLTSRGALSAYLTVGTGGHLAARVAGPDGKTLRYLCAPGDLLRASEKTLTPPEERDWAEMAQEFSVARRPTLVDLRVGERWACLVRARFLNLYRTGKREEKDYDPFSVSFSLLRFGRLLFTYTGAPDRSDAHLASFYYQRDAVNLGVYGMSFLAGTLGPADLRLGWERRGVVKVPNWYEDVQQIDDEAKATVRFDPNSHLLHLKFTGHHDFTKWTSRYGVEGYATCSSGR